MKNRFKIATFYRFTPLEDLDRIKLALKTLMESNEVFGTIIIAKEGFNATVSASDENLDNFLLNLSGLFDPLPEVKFSSHQSLGFRRRKVKIKNEIVTMRKQVDMSLGSGTHVAPRDWDRILADSETVLIDARNDYEFKVGTFKGAINPGTEKFSSLPEFVDSHLDPNENKTIATFCTGGIRCEKLAPYLVDKGFENVYQLEGGILKYLEETRNASGLWDGECFVFDERVTVDEELKKGNAPDFSSAKVPSQESN